MGLFTDVTGIFVVTVDTRFASEFDLVATLFTAPVPTVAVVPVALATVRDVTVASDFTNVRRAVVVAAGFDSVDAERVSFGA